jgi:exopolysaccharide production protein ExoZ
MLELFEISSSRHRLSAMEGLRAYAAFIVFLVHFVIISATLVGYERLGFNPRSADSVSWLMRYLGASQHGVDIFFLLSGYLITGMALKERFDYKNFIAHRFGRIYPAFVAALLVFGCYHAFFVHDKSIGIDTIIANLLLLNGVFPLDIQAIDSVTWSLTFEFAFYLIFPPLLASFNGGPRRRVALATLVTLPLIIAATCADARFIRFALFLAGAWLRVIPQPALVRLRPPEWLAVVVYLAAATTFVWRESWLLFVPIFILPAFALCDRVLNGGGVLSRFFSLRPLRIFGNISYSFYLLHPAGLIAARYAAERLRLEGLAAATLTFAAGLLVSVVLAAASFLLFERPYFILVSRTSHAQQRSAA